MAPRPSRIVIQTTVDPGRLPANWVGRQSEPGQGVMTPRRWRPIAATPIGGEADRRHEARRAAKTEAVRDRTCVPPKVDRFGNFARATCTLRLYVHKLRSVCDACVDSTRLSSVVSTSVYHVVVCYSVFVPPLAYKSRCAAVIVYSRDRPSIL